MSQKWVTPAYLQVFTCLGSQCPDTCCQSWDIHYDQKHFNVLEQLAKSDKALQEQIHTHLPLLPQAQRTAQNYVRVKFDDNGQCPFLDENKWCAIHRKYGIDALSNICMFYPRVFSRHGDTVEMTGALSCPEVARLCLSRGKQSDWLVLDENRTARHEDISYARVIDSRAAHSYQQGFVAVRQAMLKLIQNTDYSFEARLLFLANFTDRLSRKYSQSHAAVDPAYVQELDRMTDPQVLRTLDDFYDRYYAAEPVAIIVIQAVLQLFIQQNSKSRFADVIRTILESYAEKIRTADDLDIYVDNMPPAQLWAHYQEYWNRLNSQWGVELEKYLTHYCVNCLQREWFTGMPDPFVYIQMLIVRVAILKFIISSHAPVQDFVARYQHQPAEMHRQYEDEFLQRVTDLVYQFARNIDQNSVFLQVIFVALSEQQMMSYEYSLPMIKF